MSSGPEDLESASESMSPVKSVHSVVTERYGLSHLIRGEHRGSENDSGINLVPSFSVRNTFLSFDDGQDRLSVARSISMPASSRSDEKADGTTKDDLGPRIVDEGNTFPSAPNDEAATAESEILRRDWHVDSPSSISHDVAEDLNADLKTDILPKIAERQHLSFGSKAHYEGRCRPCLFFNASQNCKNGILCHFCHHEHTFNSKMRLDKRKRSMLQKIKDREERNSRNWPVYLG